MDVKRVFRVVFRVVLPTLLVCLLLLEFGLRAIGQPPWSIASGYFAKSESSYRLRKDFSKKIHTNAFKSTVYINSLGFRDRESGPRKISSKPYMVFLGESNTFGTGVDFEESFVGIIGEQAEKRGIDVVNLAVGGHGIKEQEAVLRDFVKANIYSPCIVIICFSPQSLLGFYSSYSNILVKNGHLFLKKNWILPYLEIELRTSLASYCFLNDRVRKIVDIPSQKVQSIQNILRPYKKDAQWATDASNCEANLIALEKYVNSLGADPMYFNSPPSTDYRLSEYLSQIGGNKADYDFDRYNLFIKNYCHKEDIELIDLFPQLSMYQKQGNKVAYDDDPHFNPAAHRIIANAIIRALWKDAE